tara:strand:- start:1468 stop:2043 length:576 start_codon:yes stop_codon:yes gene_type:complete
MIIKNNKINHAIKNLEDSNIIIYETDTLYGLGADATNSIAINKINKLKKRKTPLSIMLKSIDEIENYAIIKKTDFNFIERLFPGPFTILCESRPSNLSNLVQQSSNKIGIRVPDNKFCLDLLNQYNKPIITTSVNLHGQKALNNIDEIQKTFFNIDIYAGNINNKSKGSTILDFTEEKINIVRQGDGIYNI